MDINIPVNMGVYSNNLKAWINKTENPNTPKNARQDHAYTSLNMLSQIYATGRTLRS